MSEGTSRGELAGFDVVDANTPADALATTADELAAASAPNPTAGNPTEVLCAAEAAVVTSFAGAFPIAGIGAVPCVTSPDEVANAALLETPKPKPVVADELAAEAGAPSEKPVDGLSEGVGWEASPSVPPLVFLSSGALLAGAGATPNNAASVVAVAARAEEPNEMAWAVEAELAAAPTPNPTDVTAALDAGCAALVVGTGGSENEAAAGFWCADG